MTTPGGQHVHSGRHSDVIRVWACLAMNGEGLPETRGQTRDTLNGQYTYIWNDTNRCNARGIRYDVNETL